MLLQSNGGEAEDDTGARQLPDVEDIPGDVPVSGWSGSELEIREALLRWYDCERRRLPWRGDPPPWSENKAKLRSEAARRESSKRCQPLSKFFRLKASPQGSGEVQVIDLDESAEAAGGFPRSAYGVWVSEVMLQQTQVEVVIGYWTRWMDRFPSIDALAAATAEEVNAAWAGLGFYGRARRLHEGARYVMEHHGGELPQNIEDLLRIPGVGPYTAGAIASIAFNKRAAVVDGNVVRVFSRLAALTGHGKSPALHRQCWTLAEALLHPERPSTFNQALMELGATVCTPLAPACSRCPVRTACKAHKLAAAGTVTSVTGFPAKQASQKPRRQRVLALAAVANANGAWMLVRRPPNGLLAGQLEFPSIELGDQTQGTSQAISSLRETLADFGLCPDMPLTTLGAPIEHVFSHEHHFMHVFRGTLSAGFVAVEPKRDVLWLTPTEAEEAGITSGLQKVLHGLVPEIPAKRAAKRHKR